MSGPATVRQTDRPGERTNGPEDSRALLLNQNASSFISSAINKLNGTLRTAVCRQRLLYTQTRR